MSSMRNKTSTKKVKKVTTQGWQCWHDQLMMCFSLFFSEPIYADASKVFYASSNHPMPQPCRIYHCGHVITSTIPFTYGREGVLIGEFIHSRFSWTHRGEVLWRSRCLEHVAKLVKWSDISVAMLHKWPFEVVKTTGRWSSICSLISHVQVRNFFNEDLNKPLRLEALVFVRYHFASKWITVVVSSMYLPRLPRHSFQKCFF